MMDPFSAASGIAGLIAIAVKTAQMVGEYVTLVHEHKKHAEELHKELLLMKEVLDQLKDMIQEERRNGRLTSANHEDRNTVLGKAFSDCTKTIEQIQERLKEPVNKFKKAMAKFQWPFEQKEIHRMVESLRKYTQLFQLSLTVANCDLLSKTFEAASEGLKLQRNNCKEVERVWAGFPQMAKAAEETLSQTETLLKLIPALQEVSLDIREIGLAQREAEQREYGT
jgi:Fungal N-terminal domain of STAND proteins